MATAEEANEFFGMMAQHVETTMKRVAPHMAFTIVFWVRGDASNADAIAICGPPGDGPETEAALITAAASLGDPDAH